MGRNRTYYMKVTCVITGGILVHLCLGSMYIFGNVSPYLISYLRNRTSERSLRNEDALWIMNAASISGPVATTTGGLINRFLGVRIATGIGCTIFSSGVALTYFAIQKSLVLVALSYGFMACFGSSIAYGPPAQNAVMWLPERPTFAVGMIVCGFGGGALIFNQVVTAFINPENLSPDLKTSDGERYFTDKAVLDRVPKMFLLLAGIYVCLQFVGVLLIFSLPKQNEEVQVNKSDIRSGGKEPVRTVLRRLFTNKNAYIWWCILFLIYGGMVFVNSLYKTYGQTFISDDHFLALVGSISSIFNSVCRPMWGIMMDKYGFQVAVKSAAALFVCFITTLVLTETLGKVAFLIWICGLFATSSCLWSIGPATLAKLFGADHMAINMGFLFLSVSAATLTGGFVAIGLQVHLGWHGLFLLSGIMGTIAFILTFFFDGTDTEGNKI